MNCPKAGRLQTLLGKRIHDLNASDHFHFYRNKLSSSAAIEPNKLARQKINEIARSGFGIRPAGCRKLVRESEGVLPLPSIH